MSVGIWLPESDAQQNGSGLLYEFSFGILNGTKGQKSLLLDEDYQAARKARIRVPKVPTVRTRLEQAMEWKKRLETEPGLTRAALAKEVGVDPSRLTHILNLLKLAPEIQRHVLEMGESVKRSPLSERRLGRIARLEDPAAQIAAFRRLCGQ